MKPKASRPHYLVRNDEARQYGVTNAIVLKKLRYWTKLNRRKHGPGPDGYVRVYQSQTEWIRRDFPFLDIKTFVAATKFLEAEGLLFIEKMRPRQARARLVLRYRLADELLDEAGPDAAHAETDLPHLTAGSPQNGQVTPPRMGGADPPKMGRKLPPEMGGAL